jgi:hypothetical protein
LDLKTSSILSTKYGGSIEALDELLKSCHITEISVSLSQLTNGIEYSFVEVTSDGVQYGLQAYGNEAIQLNKMALDNVPKE